MGILLLIAILMYSTIGAMTVFLFAILSFVQATMFSIKGEYYDKFLEFTNPRLYTAYNEKGNDYLKKKRKMNIIGYYILSVVWGYYYFDNRRWIDTMENNFSINIPAILIGLVFAISVYYLTIMVAKKSKTATGELVLNIILGVFMTMAMFVFVFYIFLN